MHNHSHVPLWQTRGGVVLLGFLAIAAFYLLTEHTAHVFGALPYLLILACPLMHLFMHHGHGGHQGNRGLGGRTASGGEREQTPGDLS